MLIKDMVNEAFQTACEKGWHEESLTIADGLAGENERQLANAQFCTRVALIHSEASEVLEAFRVRGDVDASQDPETGKPEGVPSELADIVIRIGDLCGLYGIDLEAAIRTKMDYNKTRAHRHGNKVV